MEKNIAQRDANSAHMDTPGPKNAVPAACNLNAYLPLLKNKKVGLLVNQTSTIGKTHLVDTLLKLHIDIQKIYSPEHGFRGEADAGEKVKSEFDEGTGIMMVSLYGEKRKPSVEDLKGIDILVYDIQDIGVRFYTYNATMSLAMEACAETAIPFLILDRPNPNGYFVDGPVMQKEYQSFIGMHPVPVVYGLSIGEYAHMVNGEGWLKNGIKCNLTVIPCADYDHTMTYDMPVKPSPNIPNLKATLLYPSTCFFEGTICNEGRGTNLQFINFGHPKFSKKDYEFTPVSMPGAKAPKLMDQKCYGYNLNNLTIEEIMSWKRLNFKWLLIMYNDLKDSESFFLKTSSFNRLAGGKDLMEMILAGKTEDQIRASWKPGLDQYKTIRKKYLLYKDFE
ncbi:MAG: DUF1343 domain-containing protein [Saprospiraceae bacterium]